MIAQAQAAEDKTLSKIPSMAVGASFAGPVKGWTSTSAGRVGWTDLMQDHVIEVVALGFMRRMRMGFWDGGVEEPLVKSGHGYGGEQDQISIRICWTVQDRNMHVTLV